MCISTEQLKAFWMSCLTTERLLLRLEDAAARDVEGLSVASLARYEVPLSLTSRAVLHLLKEALIEPAPATSPRDGSTLWRITNQGRQYLAAWRHAQASERARTFKGWRQSSLFEEVE
jgi:hypothetical protein